MAALLSAHFLASHPVRSGMVRAILDTLVAQGGPYEPLLVRRAGGDTLQNIVWSRPAGLLDEVTREGTHTTFLRVADGRPQPVLSMQISRSPRTRPSLVTLTLPDDVLSSTQEVERILGVCKGLYLFLESPWATVRVVDTVSGETPDARRLRVQWANYFGSGVVAHVGPARLLTSLAFIVEILPDGGIMLVTHATPRGAETSEGQTLRAHIEESTGIGEALRAAGLPWEQPEDAAARETALRIRRRPIRGRS